MMAGRILGDTSNLDNYPGQMAMASDLAPAYALFALQPPVLQATAEAVHWPASWQSLFFKVTARTVGSQMLRISVTDNDPETAKILADEIAHQLILQGPVSSQQKQAQDQQAFVGSQLAQLKLQIESGQKSLTNLTNQAALENDAAKLNDLNVRISTLQAKIADWQRNYASLSALLSSGGNLFVTVLATAQTPKDPVSPNIPQNVLFAALAGLVLAGGVILLLEYLDDTVKSPDDVNRVLSLSTLGAITRIAGIREPQDHIITVKHPRSPIAEAYRVLRTNLRFSGIENPSGALLVTSSGPGEGKTTTAANLAVAMAQSGRRVILMDTDLRRPSVHKFFGLPNGSGLSNLFLDDTAPLESILQPTPIEGLEIITSGPLPPNPAEILDSKRMNDVLAKLRSRSDMLILDSPPVLAVADASILGSRCSGAILVIDSGRTRTEASKRSLETLRQTGAKVYGAVLNKLSSRRATGYYYYYYYSSQKGASKNGHKHSHKEQAKPDGASA